jgi:hypothetical protein
MAPSALTITVANNDRWRRCSRRLPAAPPEKEERPWYLFLRYRGIRQRGCRRREKQCSDKPRRLISDISQGKAVSSHFLRPPTPAMRASTSGKQRLAPIDLWERSEEACFTIEASQMLHGPGFAESRTNLGCLTISPCSGHQPATTHRTDHRRCAEILVTVGSDADANQHTFR